MDFCTHTPPLSMVNGHILTEASEIQKRFQKCHVSENVCETEMGISLFDELYVSFWAPNFLHLLQFWLFHNWNSNHIFPHISTKKLWFPMNNFDDYYLKWSTVIAVAELLNIREKRS